MLRSLVGILLGIALVAGLLAACANPRPTVEATPQAASPSPPSTAVVSLSPAPTLLPDLNQAAHTGALLTATQGTGAGDLDLSVISSGSHVAIRFACLGPKGARLTDSSGGVLMGVTGCDGHGIYGADFTSSASDRMVSVSVAPSVTWEIAIFWTMA